MTRVSFYIPCFNAEKTLAACLESVLCPSVGAQDVVVVDDGSTDQTAQVASRYPVRLARHNVNRGLAASRNTGIKETRGALVASIDADCVCEKDWLERLLPAFDDPGIAGAGGKLLETHNSRPADLWRSVHMKQHWGDEVVRPPFLFGANTVFRREALEAAGFYDTSLKNNYEDVDLCARLKRSGQALVYEPRAVVYHLRQDRALPLLETYWRWYAAYYHQESFYASPERFRFKLQESLGTANRYLEEDMDAGRRSLVYLDLLFAFHHSLKDLRLFMAEKQIEPAPEATRLSLWTAFVDLVFFSRFDADAPSGFRSLVKPALAYEQNCFALAFVLGRYLGEKFPDGSFGEVFFRHLFLALFDIDDSVLCAALFKIIREQPDWRCFREKDHPYLDKDFLEGFFQVFEVYMERLIFRFPDVVDAIQASAGSVQAAEEVS